MKTLLILTCLTLMLFAGQTISAQKLEDNCAIQAWITDKDPNGLNVRNKPNAAGKVIAKLKNGTETDDLIIVYVTGYSNGWVKIGGAIKMSGENVFQDSGWVSAKMLAVSTKGDPNYDAPAPLFEQANKSSRKLGTIPSDTTVMIAGYDCFGLKVTYKNKTGWLSTNNICGNPETSCS